MGTALVYIVLCFDHIWHVENPCCGHTKCSNFTLGDTIFSGPGDRGPEDPGTWDPGTQIGMHCACMYGSLEPR